ncbi:MAG: rRNA maturation RNase YbeY [Proteobacteria bacterium]|nr:rRNA maturation RNase YbeY [Pseudomonadota bacterium]
MRPRRGQRAGAPEIDIRVASRLWRAQPQAARIARAAIRAAAAALSTADRGIGVLLADDATMRAINRDWRGIDAPTNVLAFPSAITTASVDARPIGDIVIAYETLARECDDEDRMFLHHLAHLTVHGFLHLIGYDHQVDAEAEEMEALESKIMALMAMPDPYAVRA